MNVVSGREDKSVRRRKIHMERVRIDFRGPVWVFSCNVIGLVYFSCFVL